MTLIATTIAPGCVRVYDTGMGRVHFLSESAWNALDKVSADAQSRLAAAAEFTFGGQGEPIKPIKLEPAWRRPRP